MRFLLAVFALCCSLHFYEQRAYRACYECKNKQVFYANLLVAWASDHKGAYPRSLEELRCDFVKELPTCPASGRPPAYRHGDGYFALSCAGENHPGLMPPHCPAYTATRGPLGWNSLAEPRPRLPWILLGPLGLLVLLSLRRLRPC